MISTVNADLAQGALRVGLMGSVLQMRRLRLKEGNRFVRVHSVVQPGLGPSLWNSQGHVPLPHLRGHTEDRHRGSVRQVSPAHSSEHLDPGDLALVLPQTGPCSLPDAAAGVVGVILHPQL